MRHADARKACESRVLAATRTPWKQFVKRNTSPFAVKTVLQSRRCASSRVVIAHERARLPRLTPSLNANYEDRENGSNNLKVCHFTLSGYGTVRTAAAIGPGFRLRRRYPITSLRRLRQGGYLLQQTRYLVLHVGDLRLVFLLRRFHFVAQLRLRREVLRFQLGDL